ncbi:RHS repeat-associated core domain-containing protein [Chryseobacterium arthrosphaerae]|uniref:RHS repeat domain-containing protein n=1 Tax=Chryseobacterium arthrosphaerae TaxID=651561 RepID=UPI0023E11DA7|nr:RHS repeat-associated core domain-containing protein [Chryseobacterium arthrosphaerae]WES98264.1 RHS repeat-associated core domain-containing protein [Chryseobacterium arthrosphaerae]
MELNSINSQLVTRLYESANQVSRFKDFRYRGIIINLQNNKTVGFRQMASSTWFFTGLENTKVWSGIETDPFNEAAPIKEWTIRTDDETNVFPIDISENNTQLLSFKSTLYQTDKILNGQLVTSPVTDANKPYVVTAMIPKSTKTKDFLTGTSTINEITYGDYYLPSKSTSNINSGFALNTSTFEYTHNPSGAGSNYFIGRPKSKTDLSAVYGDMKSTKEEYTYDNNQLKTLKVWNRDNTGYLLETYDYNDFGILAEKVISNSIDSQTQTTKTEYDPKGRFVLKKTDNLGLETHFTYNDWGQIRTQTDHLGNILTNTYDGWGKLLTSKTNLGGTTTYEYVRDSNSNITAIQNYPDGNISKKYTNVFGQEYKASTKAFGQGQYVSTETKYDVLGRKLRDSEPYFEGQSPVQWNVIKYDDTVFPPIVTSTSLAKLNTSGEIISFSGKKIVTTISGLTTTVKEENGYGRTTSKTSDALGNVILSLDKGGTIAFSYNAASEQIKAQYAENVVTTKYDVWGRKSEFNDPSNGTYKYEYNGLGQPKKITSPKGTKEYAYNNLGQLKTQKELSASDNGEATNKMLTYSYDNKGRLITKSGTSKGKAYSSSTSYDSQGRVLSSSESSNGKYFIQKGITYDDKARVISYEKQLYSSGTLTKVKIENVYSPWSGELYQVKDSNSGKILWELKETDDRGQVLKANLGETEIKNLYDGNGFLTSVNHSSIIKPDILQLIYSFDAVKNELRTRTTGGDFSISETFDYDDNNRLINWTNPVTGIKPSSNRNIYDVKGRITQNDKVGTIKFENSAKIYQSTGMILNSEGAQRYNNDLIQTIVYNENNDPVFINGEKGDVAFHYGLAPMRQMVTYGGNFSTDGEGNFTKFYSENGSFEVIKDNMTGKEKHILYIGGSPYESNIIFLKNFDESNASYKFLHKDYLGSILAVSDDLGNKLEQRHFDAWGNMSHLKIGNGAIIIDENIINNAILLLDRGYTSHEHFAAVGIIHMNGKLYDPTLRRFLNADENIQDPHNTQNYNKYGYVMNNPMMYNDPTGEFWAWIIGAVVGSYVSGVQANNGNMNPVKWDWKSTWTSVLGGGIAGAAIGGGIQNISTNGTKFIQNSVVGTVGSIFNGLGNGQNIFKSALIGFAGINYSFDISGNSKTSLDRMGMVESGYNSFESSFYNDPKRHLLMSLEDEMWAAGLNPYDQNVYGRSDELIQKVPSIRKLANAITSRKGVLNVVDVLRLNSAGLTDRNSYLISIKVTPYNNINLLGYGHTLSHEMIHAFDLQFNMPNWLESYGSMGSRGTDLHAFRELRAYDWNIRKGLILQGQQIPTYEAFKKTVEDSWVFKQKINRFKIINPWR